VVDLTTGAIAMHRAGAIQPEPPVLVWHTSRSVILPRGADAVEINVDSGTVSRVGEVNGLNLVTTVAQPTAPLVELLSRSASVAQQPRVRFWWGTTSDVSIIPTPSPGPSGDSIEDRPIFAPPWIGGWSGPGWSTVDLYVRLCAPVNVPLPPELGTSRLAVGAVNANGLYAGTLVTVDDTTLEVLGFADDLTVLVSATSPQVSTVILSWDPRSGLLQLVSNVTGFAALSIADMIPSS
jgi:hypothetical protein